MKSLSCYGRDSLFCAHPLWLQLRPSWRPAGLQRTRVPLRLKVRRCERSLYEYSMSHMGLQGLNWCNVMAEKTNWWATKLRRHTGGGVEFKNSKMIDYIFPTIHFGVLGSIAHARCVTWFFLAFSLCFCVVQQNVLSEDVTDKAATGNNMMYFWSSVRLQSVGKQLPVASSNDTFYRCHVLSFRKRLHYSGVSKNVTLSLSHLHTP